MDRLLGSSASPSGLGASWEEAQLMLQARLLHKLIRGPDQLTNLLAG